MFQSKEKEGYPPEQYPQAPGYAPQAGAPGYAPQAGAPEYTAQPGGMAYAPQEGAPGYTAQPGGMAGAFEISISKATVWHTLRKLVPLDTHNKAQ